MNSDTLNYLQACAESEISTNLMIIKRSLMHTKFQLTDFGSASEEDQYFTYLDHN